MNPAPLDKPNKDQVPKSSSKNNRSFLVEKREVFAGPLPHPAILNGYEQIEKGSADRIIKMAEQQSTHRQYIEKKIVDSNVTLEKIGIIFSLIVTLAFITGGFFLIYSDKQWTGFTTLAGILVVHAYNFFKQTRVKKK